MDNSKVSVTYTWLIFAGLFIAVVGLVLAALGVGGALTFELSIGGARLSTSSTGLAVLVVGALLAGGVALEKPADVRLLGGR